MMSIKCKYKEGNRFAENRGINIFLLDKCSYWKPEGKAFAFKAMAFLNTELISFGNFLQPFAFVLFLRGYSEGLYPAVCSFVVFHRDRLPGAVLRAFIGYLRQRCRNP